MNLADKNFTDRKNKRKKIRIFLQIVIQSSVEMRINTNDFHQTLALAAAACNLIRDHLNFAAYFCDFRQK